MTNWIALNTEQGVEQIAERSKTVPCLIFKHSTRCSISTTAKSRLERNWNFDAAILEPYYLDLLSNRSVSNRVADFFEVEHQSPQVLLIVDGECVYEETHNAISVTEIDEQLLHYREIGRASCRERV